MPKTIIVCGYGPGISDAVANKFAGQGFQVALVARSVDKLDNARRALQTRDVKAAAFPTDLSDPNAAKGLVKRVAEQLGPVTAIHWNAYANVPEAFWPLTPLVSARCSMWASRAWS